MKRLIALALMAMAAAVVIRSDEAQAELGVPLTTSAACCQLTTSMVNDVIRGNDSTGDERFFMSEGAPPNIHFIIDNSGSMRELPQVRNSDEWTFFNSEPTPADPNYTGCTNTYLLARNAAGSWNSANAYPPLDQGTGLGSDTGFPNLFQENKYYTYGAWGDWTNPNNPPAMSQSTADDVCKSLHPNYANTASWDYTQEPRCVRCLNERGFYKVPGVTLGWNGSNANKFVLWGKYLNFNPPKYVILRKVLKDVVKDLRRVRAGYSTFATDGSEGGDLRQGQNPSCKQIAKDSSSFDNNRASYINDINSISFRTSTPLAETLLNVGQYFSSSNSVYKDVFGFGNSYLKNSYKNGSLTSEGRSWCWGCQISSVIIITDGEPNQDNNLPRSKITSLNGGEVKCPDYNGDGVGDCKNAEDNDDSDLLDDVAKMLNTQDLQQTSPPVVGDLNTAGRQSMSVYAIGLGVQSAILRNASEGVGGGLYFEAADADALKTAILDIISSVQTRATAFAAASVASLQVNKTGGSLLPRFKPARQGSKSPWQGLLYRFELGSERMLGCDPVQAATRLAGGSGDPKDYNQDGDCDDINLMDKDPVTGAIKDPVIEDDQGNFVKLQDPLTPATPFWEAGAVMNTTATQDWKTRKIYTVIDNGRHSGSGCTSGTDGKLDRCDSPIPFDQDHVADLREYLGITSNPLLCSTLATQLGLASLSSDDCAKMVINYYRGADVLNPDPAMRDKDQAFLLHDIFHSAPIIVEPLADRTVCGTNQCIESLFAGKTPQNPSDAYDQAVKTYGTRDRIALVGSNGGMLHAFSYGAATTKDPITNLYNYDAGTGRELWAFVPPDLLPKLRMNMGKHAYFVDGTAMVRDVWLDKNGNKQKEPDEFRTVAVVGEGEGGVHRFALDLTRLIGQTRSLPDQASRQSQVPDTTGDFLWSWPQPCDEDGLDLEVGESAGNFAPRAPPIGPVAIANSNGPLDVGGTKAEERWIAFFNGGADRYGVRGRGMAIVDLNDGSTLWSFFNGSTLPNAEKLKYPFPAPVAMMDMGNSDDPKPDRDLLFDTATVADFGGQVWTVRFWNPGTISSGKVSNWFAARAFQSQANNDKTVRVPFGQMTSNAVQPDTGYLRTFVGSGDRQNLMDNPGPICRLSNPAGCARQGCNVDYKLRIDRGGAKARESREHYDDYEIREATDDHPATSGAACEGAKIRLEWHIDNKNACAVKEDGNVEYTCDGLAATTWSCRNTHNDWITRAEVSNPLVNTNARFYGIWAYGVNPAHKFNDATGAQNFDENRLNDAQLVDVTNATINATGTPSISAGSLSKGWMVRYGAQDERTGSSSTIVNGCVLWNSFEPSGGAALCTTAGTNVARFYQGGFVSGAPNCAAGFYDPATGTWSRSIARDVVAVPGEPAVQRSVYGGQGGTSIITLEAGHTGSDSVSKNQDLVQSIYSLEVDRAMHDCRHEGDANACK